MQKISRAEYVNGKGFCCPNFKHGGHGHCPESSLSVDWAIGQAELIGTLPIIHCFQCGEVLGEVVE